MKKIVLSVLLLSSSVQAEEVLLGAKPFPTGCKVGITCNIAGEHSILLKNTENQERCYVVTYRICAESDCYTKEFNIKVGAKQSYFDKKIINLFKDFNYQSRHEVHYYTSVYSPYISKQIETIKQIDVG